MNPNINLPVSVAARDSFELNREKDVYARRLISLWIVFSVQRLSDKLHLASIHLHSIARRNLKRRSEENARIIGRRDRFDCGRSLHRPLKNPDTLWSSADRSSGPAPARTTARHYNLLLSARARSVAARDFFQPSLPGAIATKQSRASPQWLDCFTEFVIGSARGPLAPARWGAPLRPKPVGSQ
jgi:hypothetical protein